VTLKDAKRMLKDAGKKRLGKNAAKSVLVPRGSQEPWRRKRSPWENDFPLKTLNRLEFRSIQHFTHASASNRSTIDAI